MKFENRFNVDAPIGEVWDALMDVERVAPCLPGARVLERTGDDAYKVGIKVKVGPVTMNYRGDVEVTGRDTEAHRATMRVKAKEARGQGTANAEVEMVLSGDNGSTDAAIDTDVRLSGKAAAMGQGVIAEVSANLVDRFALNLSQMLSGEEQPAPDGTSAPPAGETSPPAAEPAGTAGTDRQATPGAGDGDGPPDGESGDGEDSLDALPLIGSVVAGRLAEPRTLGLVLVVVALLGFLLGRRSAR